MTTAKVSIGVVAPSAETGSACQSMAMNSAGTSDRHCQNGQIVEADCVQSTAKEVRKDNGYVAGRGRRRKDVKELKCVLCSHKWISKNGRSPVKCPKCRSTKWDQEYAKLNTCKRCGHEWRARSADPRKCPSCQSTRWSSKSKGLLCKRCGHEWDPRGENIPRKCPSCKTQKWDEGMKVSVCGVCGHTRAVKSNSRVGMCPICDAKVQARHCVCCGHDWRSSRGRNPKKCPSCGERDWSGLGR